jgi:hypothetical protein
MIRKISAVNRSLVTEWTYITMVAEPQADEDTFCACDAEESTAQRAKTLNQSFFKGSMASRRSHKAIHAGRWYQ